VGLETIDQFPSVCHDLAALCGSPLPNRTPGWGVLFPEEQSEDKEGAADAEGERYQQEDEGLGPAEVQRPADAAAQRDEERGIARVEIEALEPPMGVACGAQAETFTGLSGPGDAMVTCCSKHSRNRSFGERCGRGEKPAEVAASMEAIAEGYPTTRSAYQLARRHDVTTPIIAEVFAMLYEGKDVRQGVRDLMSRDLKAED